MKDRRWLCIAFFVSMLIADQVTKQWARTAFVERQQPGFPFPGVLEFTLTYNKGIAFGLMQGSGLLMTPIALLIAFFALNHSWKNPDDTRWSHTAMGLLAAGALGNLYDRLFEGRVTDMVYVRAINFPVFNLADACITSAAIMLMISWGREAFRPHENPAQTQPVETADNATP